MNIIQDREGLQSASTESIGIPSDNLVDLLEQLGTLNNRHEQLKALVEALEVQNKFFFFFIKSILFLA